MNMKSKCSRDLYLAFIRSTEKRYTGLALSEVSPKKLSHDSVSRWLREKNLRPSEIWKKAKEVMKNIKENILIFDDTVIEKERSKKGGLIRYQYSGNKHGVVLGINVINNLSYNEKTKEMMPIDFRIYDPEEDGKTKNEHFREMINLARKRKIKPKMVVMDSWYSSLKNLMTLKNAEYFWVVGLRKNRKMNDGEKLEELDIPREGLEVYLKGYGKIKVFRFEAKNGYTKYYGTNKDCSEETIANYIDWRWNIETYHRELKQTCGIERCQAHTCRSQRNHILLSIMAWILQRLRCGFNKTIYQEKWDVIKKAIGRNMETLLGYNIL